MSWQRGPAELRGHVVDGSVAHPEVVVRFVVSDARELYPLVQGGASI